MSAAAARRRASERLPREERMAAIMEAARAVFCEHGYANASTAEIARKAGVVEGALYRYFPSKKDLLIKVVEDFYERVFSDYEQQLKGVRGVWNSLRFMIWKHLSVIHANPVMCGLIFNELRATAEYRNTSVFELNRKYTQLTLAIVKSGIASGELRADVPLQIVRDVIFGGAEHHTWAFLRGEGRFSPDQAADAITNLIYHGLAAAPTVRAGAQQPDVTESTVQRLERVTKRLEALEGRKSKPR
jgi:TetR/AcrR family transcriptional regulator, fatty acid metabolism regulator protein